MKVNALNLAIVKGDALSMILEYKEDSRRVYTDYTGYVFKAQIRSARTIVGVLQATLTVVPVGLGQLRVSLTTGQVNALTTGSFVWDLLASVDGIVEPEVMYSGTVTVSPMPVVAPLIYATQWENDAPTTTMTPVAGLYNVDKVVTLAVNDANAKIYYTVNGSTPTALSTRYTAPFTVTATTTVKFFAVDTAGNAEAVQTVQIDIDKVAAVTTCDQLEAATFTTATPIGLTTDEPAAIYYTTDGSTPTLSSTLYSAPFTLAEGAYTVKFFSVDTAGNAEAVKTLHFTVTA